MPVSGRQTKKTKQIPRRLVRNLFRFTKESKRKWPCYQLLGSLQLAHFLKFFA